MLKPILIIFALGTLSITAYLWFVPRTVNKPNPTITNTDMATAIFAGGCFWCTESDFEKREGVIEVISGYSGGTAETATYKQTSNKTTQHREVVQVQYDPSLVSYKALVDFHLRHTNPTDNEGQFVDRGYVYSPAIFYQTETEKTAAQQAISELQALNVFKTPVNIAVEPRKPFYPAEAYHQDYYLKNPVRYQFYRDRSGRDQFLESTWQ